MASGTLKPIKIQIKNNTASGMYILLEPHEVRCTKDNETKPPNRKYNIEIAVEVIYDNKRCRGKKTFPIARGTSIIKAVESLQVKKQEMIQVLKTKGTLKREKPKEIVSVDSKDRRFEARWEAFINAKSVSKRKNTLTGYQGAYNQHLYVLNKKNIEDIKIDDIQAIILSMKAKGREPATIKVTISILKGIFRREDISLKWNKLELPEVTNERKFHGTIEDFKNIVSALLNYEHKEANAIFKFSLTGRRVSEIVNLRYEDINWKQKTFTIPIHNMKNKKSATFTLLPMLEEAILSRGKVQSTGKIFKLHRATVAVHFKKAIKSLGITAMVLHDLRSAISQTALERGQDITAVSAMLAHSSTKITQQRYIDINKPELADKAQCSITQIINMVDEIENVEVIDDKLSVIKNLYPNAGDEVIKYAMDLLEANKIK